MVRIYPITKIYHQEIQLISEIRVLSGKVAELQNRRTEHARTGTDSRTFDLTD